MKILKLSPYFFPEQVSSSHLTDDLNEAFAEAGFAQENYVPTPSRGVSDEIRKQYSGKRTEVLYGGSLVVHRFSMFKEGKNPIQRAIRYILVNLIQYEKGVHAKDVDVVFSGSTPPTQGVLCGKVARRLSKKYGHKVPFIYNLQDVFPDSLIAAGMTSKGSLIWKVGRRIEDKTYRYADRIIVISEDIKRNIQEKGVPTEKIDIIPNWIDTDKVHPVSRSDNKLFDELEIDRDSFIIVYAGNLGTQQGIDVFIEAAKQVDNAEFLIFGEGSSKEEYAEKCKGRNNIHLLPLMPSSRVSEVYSMGDMSLVACKPGLGKGAVPSKTFSIMATATPVLLSFDKGTELWNLIENNACGICSEAGDVEQLVKAIRYAQHNKDEIERMSNNARACVEKAFSREAGTKKYVMLFNEQIDHQIC